MATAIVRESPYVNGADFGVRDELTIRQDSIQAGIGNVPEDDEALNQQQRANDFRHRNDGQDEDDDKKRGQSHRRSAALREPGHVSCPGSLARIGQRSVAGMSPLGQAQPRSLARTLAGGFAASGVLLTANQLAERLGITDLDLPHVLGLSFREPGQHAMKLAGAAWYFAAGGVLVPLLYWLGFRFLGRAGARPGLALGVVHYLASGLLLATTEPPYPKRRHGRGRPMGPFLFGYGPLERTVNFLGHLAYGTAVGLAAGRCGDCA